MVDGKLTGEGFYKIVDLDSPIFSGFNVVRLNLPEHALNVAHNVCDTSKDLFYILEKKGYYTKGNLLKLGDYDLVPGYQPSASDIERANLLFCLKQMRYKALCSSIPIDPVLTDKPTAQLKSLYKRINDRWNKAMVPNGAQQ